MGRGAALGKMETVLKAMSYFRKAGGVWGLLARLLVGCFFCLEKEKFFREGGDGFESDALRSLA